MTRTLTLTFAAPAPVALAGLANAKDIPMTRQKACSEEFRAQPKETRGGLAGWQTFYKACNARLKADGNTYAKRTRKVAE